jgi:hypothetical protein
MAFYTDTKTSKTITKFLENNTLHYNHFVMGVYIVCADNGREFSNGFVNMIDTITPSVKYGFQCVKNGVFVITVDIEGVE